MPIAAEETSFEDALFSARLLRVDDRIYHVTGKDLEEDVFYLAREGTGEEAVFDLSDLNDPARVHILD